MELGKVIVIIVIASVLVSGLMPVVCSRDPGNEADVIYVIEPKTLDRDSEPVVVTVNRIPAFAGYDVDDIYVWANRNNAWQQVVFQIDEVNGTFMRKDNPVVSSGPHKNYYIPDNGVMDSDDEIVFMANETGDRVNAGTWPPGTDHNISRYEITVTDPLTGNKGWAYLYYDDTNPAWTTVDYGSWTESSNYLDIYGYSLNYNDDDEHMLYYTEMNVDPNIGGTDVDIVDRNKRFVHLDVTMEPRRDEEGNCARNGLETYYSGLDNDPQYNHEYAIKDGPVRVIRHLRWGFGNANFFNDPTDKMGWRVAEEYKYYPSMYTEDEFIRHQSGTTYGEHYYRSIDHTAAAGAMAYYNSNSGTGTVNGNPADDTVTSPLLTWDQISSSHGSYITTYNISSFSGEGTCPCIKTTRWIDDSGFSETADGETRQNAEAGRYGEHGIDFVRGSPCTTYTWQTGHFYYKTYFLGADAPNIGEEYWNYSDTPLSITSPVPALQSWKDDVDPPATVAGTVLVEGVASYSVPVTAAGNVQLTGTVDETGHGGHNISSAVWTNGFANFPGTSMNAVDGTYNEITENVVCTINLAGWTAGTYEIYIYGSDDKGNQNTTSTEHATITITDNLPPATQTGSVLAGGLASYSVPFSAAGPIDLTATIDDNNRGNSDIISAVWTDGFANFPGTAMSASDGLFDSYTEAVTWTLPLDTWDAGIYDLYVYGTDASPLQNTTSTQHATVTIIDDVPPQITNALLEGQAVYSMGFSHDAFLTLTATVDDSTTGNTVIGGANFTMGAQMWASSQAMGAVTPLDSSVEDFSYLLNVSDWAPGTYFLYVYGWDSTSVFNTTSMAFATLIITNTWAPETQNVLVDGVPEVSVPFSARGTVTLTATIDDTNHGDDIIAGANYTNGKVNWPGVDMTPDTPLDSVTENFTAIVDVSDWPVGTYDLYVYGWDIQNDCNSSSTEFGRIIIYDDVAPQISDVNINGVSVFETDNVAAGTITLTARVNDTLTGNSLIGGAEYTIGAQNWPGVGMTPDSPLNTPDETFTQVVDVSSWSSGVYYLYVYGWDIVSVYNSTSQAFATLIIHDVLAPEINNVRINGSFTHNVNYASATTVVLTAEVDDTGRGDSEIGGANYSDGFINWPTSAPMSTYNDEALADILIIGTVSSDDYSAPNDFLNTAQFPDDNRYEHIQEDGSAGGPTTFYFESFETGLGVWTADNGAELARRQIGVDPLFYLGPGTVTPDGSYFIDFNDQNNVNDWIYMSSGIDMSTATANREIEFWYDPQDMDDGTETVDYSVYHDGAWSALTTIPSQNDGDFVNDAMADWTQNSPIIVDLETYGITDWTDIRLRFQSDSQWEATDEVVVDSITFRGDAPSTILEHRWQFDMGSNPTFYVDASNPAGSDSGFRFQWSDDAGLNWFEFSTPLVFNPGEEDVLKSSSIALPSYEDYFLVRVISDTPGPVVDTFSVDRMWAEGQFNNNPELVYATIDISGWQPGVYDLYVYAWDKSPQYNVTSTAHATLIIDDNLPPEIYNFLVNGVKSVTLNLSEGPITLTGTVDDTNTGNSIIKGAGFTDGYQNWNVSGGMVNDTPLDSPVETFTNVTPIYNFSAGIHRLFMYGGDVTGMNNDTSTENVTVTIIDDVPPATLNYTTLANGLSQLTLDPALTTTFTLNATISDVFFGYSNITAANWTAGPANWSAGHDLASADGTWDNSTENVTGTIDITGWPTGTYFIYVYGTDEWGNGQTLVPTYAVLHVDGIGPAITGPWADNQNPYVWETDTSFLLTAYGDDRERGYSDVVAAEYFVDAVGANGTGTPMSPMGFRFDSPYEGARATVSLVGWTPGEYHTYYVHFKDAMDHWGDVDSVFVMYNSSFSIPIHLGWNLISIPLVTPTTDLTDILSDIPNGWDYAMTYVLSPGGGYWISTSIYRPDTVNNFTYVDNTMAFWLHVTDVYDGFLDVIGAPPVSTTIDLYAGWNFIGYPTLDNTKTIADAFSTITYDSVEGYSGTDPYRLQVLPSTYVMQPGEGYWVKVPFDQTWIVNW